MVFCNADFEVSKTPAAPLATGLMAKKAVNGAAHKSKNIRELAKHTRDLLEAASGIGWHVAVGTDFAVDLRYRKNACVLLSSRGSKVKVLVYRTVPALTPIPTEDYEALLPLAAANATNASQTKKKNAQQQSQSQQLKQRVTVNECDMEPEMKERVLDIVKRLLAHYQSDPDVESKVANALKHSLTFSYGHTWHTIVSISRELCCLPHFVPNTLADVSSDKFRVVVYRHAGAPLDSRMDATQFGNRAALLLALVSLVFYGYFVFTTTDIDKQCVTVKDAEGNARIAVGCKLKDVVQANTLAAYKGMALFGSVLFTVVASGLRIYRSSLRNKAKQA